MSNLQFTAEQQNALFAILQAVKQDKKPTFTLGGYAGTGKTTVISFLIEMLPTFAVCAYTGKAANVLRRKGIHNASTIHSLIYEPKPNDRGEVDFVLRSALMYDGIIVDEASMVSREIYDDLLSFNIPVVFVGDHGQLEPVGSDFNLMKNPDYRLETIHRNAGEISRFAEWVRKDNKAGYFPMESTNQVEFLSKYEVEERGLLTSVDQIICAYNKTRVSTNQTIRERLGYSDRLLVVGERIMCLRNNKQKSVFNGMQGTVSNYRKIHSRHLMDFESYGDDFHDIPFNPEQFHREGTLPMQDKNDPIPFDYAYCITCHKSQGDEFDEILVFEQKCKNWEHRRWTYTAASRAKKKIYWVSGM